MFHRDENMKKYIYFSLIIIIIFIVVVVVVTNKPLAFLRAQKLLLFQ